MTPWFMRCHPYTHIFCHSKTPNFWFVTQRPPISDFVTQKSHHFNYLAQNLMSYNNWSQDFKGFIACGQLDVLYSINLWFEGNSFYYTLTERPHNLWSVTEVLLVAPFIERPLCLRCLVAHHSDIWVPPPQVTNQKLFRCKHQICVKRFN